MRRAAFRFGFVLAVLVMFPFPLGYVPGTERLAWLLQQPARWGVNALAALLGLGEPVQRMTGSGDTLFNYLEALLFVLAAFACALAWTAVSRAEHYDRLARGLRIALRCWVGVVLFHYGVAKLIEMQFRTPPAWILDQRVGDKSPMGLMWTFMGHSRPYTFGVGFAECLGSVLLFWRRTATTGALLLAVVMTNVVAMNFCYDVPVKLYSIELLVALLAIAGPDLRRILIAALGHATREAPPPPRGSPRFERVRDIARFAFLALLAINALRASAFLDRVVPPQTELDGTWDATGDPRWARLMIDTGVAVIRTPTDQRTIYRVRVDPRAKSIELAAPLRTGLLHYELRDRDHLVVRGTIGETWYEVTLVRAEPWLLETRGFHWIQEEPFNR